MKKILIVDDEPEVVEMTKKRLLAQGYEVITAKDGEEGYALTLAEKPDLIILDILMPKKDGLTMLRQIKTEDATREIPVILLSAKGEAELLMKGKQYGAVDYFIKPCDWDEMLKYIKRYL
jgi:adenylate cyclase